MKKKDKIKELKKKIDNETATDVDYRMYKYLTTLSGMNGMEKSLKDRIGRNINKGEITSDTVNNVFDRIEKRRKGSYDS